MREAPVVSAARLKRLCPGERLIGRRVGARPMAIGAALLGWHG